MCRAPAAFTRNAPRGAISWISNVEARPVGPLRADGDEANMVIMSAIGGEPVTTTVEGRERYTVNVRYARELRDDFKT
jgi:hypothetical protein